MSGYRSTLGLFIGMMFCLAGCQGGDKLPPGQGAKVLATVNGTPIMADDLRLRNRTAHGAAPEEINAAQALDDVIKEELCYQQGVKLGLDKDPEYRKEIDRLERQLEAMKRAEMTRRIFNTQIATQVNVTNRDAQDYYAKHADRIATDLHLAMISFPKREAAEAALKKIRSGASFDMVAAELASGAPAVAAGERKPWDMGFVTWEQLPIDFDDAVYSLKPGEVSGIIASPRTGFHIVRLIETRKNSKADFNALSGIIINRLRDRKVLEAYDRYVVQLQKDARIVKF